MRAEIRGRGREWRVFYENEAGFASPFPVFDQDGLLTGVVMAGAPDKEQWTESRAVFESPGKASEYAAWLGASEVAIVRKLTRNESLALARASRKE